MKRVLVIGAGGSGKSTFAVELAKRSGLPILHLDAHYWRPGWTEPTKEEWAAKVDALVAGELWIMDGNFGGTLERRLMACDTVVFLDFPAWICLWRVIRRRLKHQSRTRFDMTAGCNERLTLDFLWWILTYRGQRRPALLRRLAKLHSDKRVAVLRTPGETDAFLRSLSFAPAMA